MKLSIITINKNKGLGLERTIKSILSQTLYHSIEYIVVDGFSTDESKNTIETYKDYISNVIYEDSYSLYSKMNVGAVAATGEYILYLNAGDYLLENTSIESIFNIIDGKYDIYIFNQKQITYDKEIIKFDKTVENFTKGLAFCAKFGTAPQQSTVLKRQLVLDYKYDTKYKIGSETKFFTELLYYNNISYKIYPEIILTSFAFNGVSKSKTKLKETEKYYAYQELIEKYNKRHFFIDNMLNRMKPIVESKKSDDIPINVDYVLTYVNNNDPTWVKQLLKYDTPNKIYYRDWGTLKYHLRGVAQNLPFINNVYLIISGETQIPNWLDTNKVKIVYHKDILPKDKLPTFNSRAIELGMINIEGLSDYFLYANDDMFSMSRMYKSDFFDPDTLKLKLYIQKLNPLNCTSEYYKGLRHTEQVIRNDLNLKMELYQLGGNHNIVPMHLKTMKELAKRHKKEIEDSYTRFRCVQSMSQEFWNFYQYLSGNTTGDYSLMFQYLTTRSNFISTVIKDTDMDLLCINDDGDKKDRNFESLKSEIISSFETRFPNKCKYEL